MVRLCVELDYRDEDGRRSVRISSHTLYGAHRPDTLCSTQSVPITSFTAAIVWIAFAVRCPYDATNIHAVLGYFPKEVAVTMQ